MLVRIAQATEGASSARSVLRSALKYVPEDPELNRLAVELGR